MKAWLKGGLIGALVWIGLFLIYALLYFFTPLFGPFLSSRPTVSNYFHDSILVFFGCLIWFFVIGIIISWLIGKFKK